ncbi:hypothetical protein HF289_13920 [Acidithiobacillus ferrooxidans]|jgi:hypothetical protein|uniref:hypothetical protein n=1 Tax=Acidithiobacillus ferrooxidans TaxID=920 RepID=UPI001C07B78A|nr:hypothetical protein [Acidithiobacillus ferrooxidans]MBU2857912.1 hypothetical protein [Acidithiobacillus ferrooxidans]MBU2859307.1 hypothetical protein [Acidithiobacillus ferrooxidans]
MKTISMQACDPARTIKQPFYRHDPLRLETLAAILDAVPAHRGIRHEVLLDLLFER